MNKLIKGSTNHMCNALLLLPNKQILHVYTLLRFFYTFLDYVLLSNIFYSVNPQYIVIFPSYRGRDIN